jgi:hypothetical protein
MHAFGFEIFPTSYWGASLRHQIDEDDRPALSNVGTLLLPMRRERLLRYLPNKGRVAEIGVARGKFSAQVRRVCNPRYLALIDPWIEQDEAIYVKDDNNLDMHKQEQRFRKVAARFERSSAGAECKVIRKFSLAAANDFEDGFFDWIYIDANHGFDPCLGDLQAWAPKVKHDGFICGHDFANHAAARSANFGVIEAVRKFTSDTGMLLAALTIEHFPTYVIAKNASGANLRHLRDLLFSFERHIIQVSGWEGADIAHARLRNPGLPRSAYVSFDFQGDR